MTSASRYAIDAAALKGRDDAFAFIKAREKWPLKSWPSNPFLMASAEEFTVWEQAFNGTMDRIAKEKEFGELDNP